jgi:hypothetical protein
MKSEVRPIEKLPVESLDDKVIGAQLRLANDSLVWASFGNFDVTNPRATQHFVTTDLEVARSYGTTTYQLQLAPCRAIPNPFSPYSESEHLVPHYISPDEIKGTLP